MLCSCRGEETEKETVTEKENETGKEIETERKEDMKGVLKFDNLVFLSTFCFTEVVDIEAQVVTERSVVEEAVVIVQKLKTSQRALHLTSHYTPL